MSQSEDYLDSLLNSITKAKTDAEQLSEEAKQKQEESLKKRQAISPEDDFFAATGIDEEAIAAASSMPIFRRNLSEEDFLKEFEEELNSGNSDAFIDAFEREIDLEEKEFQETGKVPDSQSVVDNLLDNIDNIVSNAKASMEDEDVSVDNSIVEEPEESFPSLDDDTFPSLDDERESESDQDNDSFDAPEENVDVLPNLDDSLDTSTEEEESLEGMDSDMDDFLSNMDISMDDEAPKNDKMAEFAPDDMDALDSKEFGDEVDLSGDDDLDLDNLLSGDDDLSDLKSILDGEEDGESDINLDEEDGDSEGSDKKSKDKQKKPKKKKEPNPKVQAILTKVSTILFGPIDEEEEAAEKAEALLKKINKKRKKDPTSLKDEEKKVLSDAGQPVTEEEIAAFNEKIKAKEAKKEKPKKEEEPKKEKPKKAPKPKKPKKEKEPDNSPKIPISIIATFLVLSISIIGAVLVLMDYMGIDRHMKQANELYESGEYIACYEKLNGLELTDEDDILTRNRSRTLADLEQCQNEYESFINDQIYDFALDSLIKGVGRYEKYADDAAEYGISEQYDAFEEQFLSELDESFGLTKEEALAIYHQDNRHYYTVELRKVLIRLGLDE